MRTVRARLFRCFLTALENYTPSCVKSIQIQILLNTTAAAFGRPGERVWHLPADKALAAYAAYTKDCMQAGYRTHAADHRPGDTVHAEGYKSGFAIDRRRICQTSYRLGRRVLQITGFTEASDRERLVFWLYSNIGIRVTGHLPGEIIIPACYFSGVYTPHQCRTMSLMDWGIIAGICGGGKLIFKERITQGCGRCRACLTRKNADAVRS